MRLDDEIEARRAYNREKMRKYRAKHGAALLERRRAQRKEKMADPVFAAKEKAYRNAYNKAYHGTPANKSRRRQRDLRQKYGLTEREFESMRHSQDGLCTLCRGVMAMAVVDHCHASGKVRSLLCKDCNTGLGHFKDNATVLRRAADYLDQHGAKPCVFT